MLKIFNRSKLTDSKLVKKGENRNLYKTIFGDYFWLNENKYLDKCIIDTGYFEEESTEIVKRILKPDDIVLDIGANIGYYTVLMSRLVGEKGKVLSFEPTDHYGQIFLKNIQENNINNYEIFNYGLSNKEAELEISIGDCSATLHWVADQAPTKKELIKLKTLDSIMPLLKLERLDFIKIDVDGHEPAFLEGAWETIEKFQPIIFLEVSHEHFLDYGVTAWDFYDLLKEKGFFIYSENGFVELKTKSQFLHKCGNFAYSANIFISKNPIKI